MRKTKIICTMGPATDEKEVIHRLIGGGMNVARFNFSHGTHQEQERRMQMVREAREAYHKPVAMLLDTKGPEIRLGEIDGESLFLQENQEIVLTGKECIGDAKRLPITYRELYEDVWIGSRILIDDGLVELIVTDIGNEEIICQVKNSGKISSHKGVNVPGVHLNMPFINRKDEEDLLFGIQNQVDFVAASFTRCAQDIYQVREFLEQHGGKDILIIAKIENQEGVDEIDEIIKAADGIMIARGDLGVELPLEEVPVVQKRMIRKVCEAGKYVITATQMLESMMSHPRPTRAEAADVANAIYDGTGAIMLSGETAAGKYPVEALQTMERIAVRAEKDINYKKRFFNRERLFSPNITDAICHATCTTAHDLNVSVIVTVTKSGESARMLSSYRPSCDIIGGTLQESVSRRLSLAWGVTPLLLKEKKDLLELFSHAISCAKEESLVSAGDVAVITAGIPLGISGTTNMIKVQIVE